MEHLRRLARPGAPPGAFRSKSRSSAHSRQAVIHASSEITRSPTAVRPTGRRRSRAPITAPLGSARAPCGAIRAASAQELTDELTLPARGSPRRAQLTAPPRVLRPSRAASHRTVNPCERHQDLEAAVAGDNVFSYRTAGGSVPSLRAAAWPAPECSCGTRFALRAVFRRCHRCCERHGCPRVERVDHRASTDVNADVVHWLAEELEITRLESREWNVEAHVVHGGDEWGRLPRPA